MKKFIRLIPIPSGRKVDLVYAGETKDSEVIRYPVLFFALFQDQEEDSATILQPVSDLEGFSYLEDDDPFDIKNYLGIEFDEKKENWKKEIEAYFIAIKKSESKRKRIEK